ncbi:hypothetical protein MLD38_029681 [Melastoma candidum]|uniref:Uncharacterized protein n=1 Tax=Melastoma candidum TaxID=119954 RepID=A0ACB9N4K7_9MYRT|nr:hypothetical protein MLD38_029681 [Melastoma candidum]
MKNEKRSPSPSSFHPLPPSPTKLLPSPLRLLRLVPFLLLFASGVALGFALFFYLYQYPLQPTPAYTISSPLLSPTRTPQQPIPPPPPAPLLFPISNGTALRTFLNLPDVSRYMDDRELLRMASAAPRTLEKTSPNVPKVAFMFLVRGGVPLAPLWDEFFHGYQGKYSVYVHSSPGFELTAPSTSAFHGRNIPSKAVRWGQFSMVEAERRLLANALLDGSNSRFVLLSESCIPIFNFTTVYDYLTGSEKSFIGSSDVPGPAGRGRYNPRMRPEVTIDRWRKGAQWFGMDRGLAVDVVSDKKYARLFRRLCKGSCYPDEHYLPTLVSTKFWWRNSNRSLTLVDWSRGGPHPARFVGSNVTMDFLRRLRSGRKCEYNGKTARICFLFARKFAPNTLERLLKFAPKVMQFN